jgi:hypothetical protein
MTWQSLYKFLQRLLIRSNKEIETEETERTIIIMANGYVVLEANTPPDAAKVLAFFITGPEQGDSAALANANEFKANHFPTSTVQACTVTSYNTSVVVNP